MDFRHSYDFDLLVNEAERVVLEELEKQVEEKKDGEALCLCQDCILDMATFALNKVKPLYRVSLLGSLYAHNIEEGEYKISVAQAVSEAIEKIRKNPSHD